MDAPQSLIAIGRLFRGGKAAGRIRINEALERGHQGGIGTDMTGEHAFQPLNQTHFVFQEFGFGLLSAIEKRLPTEQFDADQAGAVDVGLCEAGFQTVGFRGHVKGTAQKNADRLADDDGTAEVDQFDGPHPVDHDVGGFDIRMEKPRLMHDGQPGEDSAENVKGEARLKHDPSMLDPEKDMHEMGPFFIRGLTPGNGEVGSLDEVLQIDPIDGRHLDTPDAFVFVIGFASHEAGALNGLEFGDLTGDTGHIVPVGGGGGINRRIMKLEGVTGGAGTSAMTDGEKDNSLTSPTQFANEHKSHGVIDLTIPDERLIIGDQMLEIRGPLRAAVVVFVKTGFCRGEPTWNGRGVDLWSRRRLGIEIHGLNRI